MIRRALLLAVVVAVIASERVAACPPADGFETWSNLAQRESCSPCEALGGVDVAGWRPWWGASYVFLPAAFTPAPCDGRASRRWIDGARTLEVGFDFEEAYPYGDVAPSCCELALGDGQAAQVEWLLLPDGGIDASIWPRVEGEPDEQDVATIYRMRSPNPEDLALLVQVARMAEAPHAATWPPVEGAEPSRECGVSLELSWTTEPPSRTRGKWLLPLSLVARLVNRGSSAVTLVRPQFGSEAGLRSPAMSGILTRDGHREPPTWLTPPDEPDIAPLRARDVVTLAPGQAIAISPWWEAPYVDEPGRHEVRLRYSNEPSRAWTPTFGSHDPEALARFRASTPCDVVSNAVTLEVPEPNPRRVDSRRRKLGR